jgi:hypothetical protein
MKWHSIPSWLIILLFCSAGAIYAFVVTRDTIFAKRSEPDPLPPLPVAGSTIYGIETSGFFRADPHIQAIDGQIYSIAWERGAYVWQINSTPSADQIGGQCSPENIRLIEESVSSVIDCKAVRTRGEWCPGTIVSIAVSEKGDVWRLVETPTCLFFFWTLMTLFVPAGFVLGVIVVVIRKIAMTQIKFTKR